MQQNLVGYVRVVGSGRYPRPEGRWRWRLHRSDHAPYTWKPNICWYHRLGRPCSRRTGHFDNDFSIAGLLKALVGSWLWHWCLRTFNILSTMVLKEEWSFGQLYLNSPKGCAASDFIDIGSCRDNLQGIIARGDKWGVKNTWCDIPEHMAFDIEGLERRSRGLPSHFSHSSDWRNFSWLVLPCHLMTVQKDFGNPWVFQS